MFVLFQQYTKKILFNFFFAPNFEYFSKYDAFFRTLLIYACLRHKTYCYQRGLKLWKNCIHEKHFSKWLVVVCSVVMTRVPCTKDSDSTRVLNEKYGLGLEFSIKIMESDSSHPPGLGLKSKLVERQNPF